MDALAAANDAGAPPDERERLLERAISLAEKLQSTRPPAWRADVRALLEREGEPQRAAILAALDAWIASPKASDPVCKPWFRGRLMFSRDRETGASIAPDEERAGLMECAIGLTKGPDAARLPMPLKVWRGIPVRAMEASLQASRSGPVRSPVPIATSLFPLFPMVHAFDPPRGFRHFSEPGLAGGLLEIAVPAGTPFFMPGLHASSRKVDLDPRGMIRGSPAIVQQWGARWMRDDLRRHPTLPDAGEDPLFASDLTEIVLPPGSLHLHPEAFYKLLSHGREFRVIPAEYVESAGPGRAGLAFRQERWR